MDKEKLEDYAYSIVRYTCPDGVHMLEDYAQSFVKSEEEWNHWKAVAAPFSDTSVPYNAEAYPVALLHDAIEDGYRTPRELEEELDLTTGQLDALEALTRHTGEKYFDYIYRVRKNPLATKVKISDLKHNISRCVQDIEHRWGLLRRYAKAYAILTDQWEE